MQPRHETRPWAARLVVFAAVAQILAWWMLSGSTFYPGGTGAKAVEAVFGKGTFPAEVAAKLEYAIRCSVLIVLALVAFRSRSHEPAGCPARRAAETKNPFA